MSTTTHTGPMPEAARLRPAFDPGRLAAELAAVTAHTWNVQRTHTHDGQVGQAATIDWRVLALRSLGGDPERTDPGGPGPQTFQATRWLDQLPYLAEVLDTIPAPLNAVRLMALGPGAVSEAHCDPKYRLDRGIVRLHIPVVTDPAAILVLDGVEHCWQPGTCWFGDFSREHLVRNTSPTVTRVHVVVDALLTADLAAWFPVSWQNLMAYGEVLINRKAPSSAPVWPAGLPYEALLPAGFADFDTSTPLDGSLIPARIDRGADGVLALTIAGRAFALVPVDDPEFRFSGWSEQRTLEPDRDGTGLTLRARHGRALAERHVAAASRTS
ncbi:aspartyl/asparaginyl beta-hydroxylase domain-containing protein [Streptomyces sp. NPDC002790]|uniref:aspartyl/asparaginyl beta-hydroxylase domain-containing protein n=1 Tax=Streptomyces sp. NPDC002790 TaxID=3154431 RepID=UPI00332B144F